MITNKVTTDAMDWLKDTFPKYGKVVLCVNDIIVIPGGKGFACMVLPVGTSEIITNDQMEYLKAVETLGGYMRLSYGLDGRNGFKAVIKDYDLEMQILDAKGVL
jgi:hypothetical protein